MTTRAFVSFLVTFLKRLFNKAMEEWEFKLEFDSLTNRIDALRDDCESRLGYLNQAYRANLKPSSDFLQAAIKYDDFVQNLNISRLEKYEHAGILEKMHQFHSQFAKENVDLQNKLAEYNSKQ